MLPKLENKLLCSKYLFILALSQRYLKTMWEKVVAPSLLPLDIGSPLVLLNEQKPN